MVVSLSVYNIKIQIFSNPAETEKVTLLLQNVSNYLPLNKHQEKLVQKFQKCIKHNP